MDNELLLNNDKLHTTKLGVNRIKNNLSISGNVVTYCKNLILKSNCEILKKGKNWYCTIDGIKITINSNTYTIVTAHRL